MSTDLKRALFGGAITASIPLSYFDGSTILPVPDNQELFLDRNSKINIVIEILQAVQDANDKPVLDSMVAAKQHFKYLAHDNSADSSLVLTEPRLVQRSDDHPTPSPIVLHGIQHIRKTPRHEHTDEVRIALGLFRVTAKNADLVVTMNVPTKAAEEGAISPEGWVTAERSFIGLVESLRILDFDLFA